MKKRTLTPSALILLFSLVWPSEAISQHRHQELNDSAPGADVAFSTWDHSVLNRWRESADPGFSSYAVGSIPIEGPDRRLLIRIHAWEGPWTTGVLGAADYAFYPLVFGAPVAAWGASMFSDRFSTDNALFVSASWVGTAGSMFILKRAFKRERPYKAISGFSPREGYPGTKHLNEDSSMPSGHAMLVASMATAASLLYPEWYVIGPATLWAVSSSVSRVWLGVHYPSDVLVGTVLGSVIATGAWLLLE